MPTPRSVLAAVAVAPLVAFGAACGDDGGSEGDDVAAYCTKVEEFENAEEFPSDEELEALVSIAPEEIRDDVSTLVDSITAEEPPEGEEADAATEAEARVTAWEAENCGSDEGEDTGGEETTGTESTTEDEE